MARNVDLVFEMLKTGKKDFAEIMKELNKDGGFSMENAATLYSDLIFDGRFLLMDDNTWDLKTRHTYDEIHPEIPEFEEEEEEEDYDEEPVQPDNNEDEESDSEEDSEDISDLRRGLQDVGDLEEE